MAITRTSGDNEHSMAMMRPLGMDRTRPVIDVAFELTGPGEFWIRDFIHRNIFRVETVVDREYEIEESKPQVRGNLVHIVFELILQDKPQMY